MQHVLANLKNLEYWYELMTLIKLIALTIISYVKR